MRLHARLREDVEHRTVHTDATPSSFAFTVTPEYFGQRCGIKSRNSIEAELGALHMAVGFLKTQGHVSTTFYTDCQSIVGPILGKAKMSFPADPEMQSKLDQLRNVFKQNSAWKLEWVKGKNNLDADTLSRHSGDSFSKTYRTTFERVGEESDGCETYVISNLEIRTDHPPKKVLAQDQKFLCSMVKSIAELTGHKAYLDFDTLTLKVWSQDKLVMVSTFKRINYEEIRQELLAFLHSKLYGSSRTAEQTIIEQPTEWINPLMCLSTEKSTYSMV